MEKLNKWHQTRLGLLIFGIVELAIAYGSVSLAIDRGNWLWYILCLVFFVGALQNLLRFIGIYVNGKRNKRAH